jgi:hypothetical protein
LIELNRFGGAPNGSPFSPLKCIGNSIYSQWSLRHAI